MTPGFNSSSLNNHGYQSGTYYRGVLQPTKLIGDFVGWNGGTRENKSSDRILEEALLLPESEEIFVFAGYTEDHTKYEKAEVTYRTLGNSIGRCMFFSPPVIQAELHRLFVLFNNPYLDRRNLSTFEIKIFLMDRASSPHLYQLTKWR